MAERHLFGTDGIRGKANVEPMTPETVLRLGRAAGEYFLTTGERRHKVVIGKDTRLSGYMFETALASGLCSMGVDVLLVGPMPTPGIAFLTRELRADAGVAISASHNPYDDNGIKFFGPDGFKLADAAEAVIESLMNGDLLDRMHPTGEAIGKAYRIDDAGGRYGVFLHGVFPDGLALDGMRVVLDCAHGAAHRIAPAVLRELGAEVDAIGIDPDGLNINEGVGALHLDSLRKRVLETGAHVGVALDGDADRALLVDELGNTVDGDAVMAVLAMAMKDAGTLVGDTVVGTVMSNFGLEVSLGRHDISLLRTPVGDRYVVERMLADGYRLGGEQSGHIVSLDHATTGDGQVTALLMLARMRGTGAPLSELCSVLETCPQTLINLRVSSKPDLTTVATVATAVREAESAMGESGRVLVRYSGTEPLARVMVEGTDEAQVHGHAKRIAAVIESEIG